MRSLLVAAALTLAPLTGAVADSVVTQHDGWRVIDTDKSYDALLADLKGAIKANKMGLVTEAGPTEVAKKRGETIPGNRVLGIFRNDFAVTIIRAAPSAMIEPPVRIMVMEEPDGTASLSYKLPSVVFAPYAEEGGAAVTDSAAQLDEIFATIADQAAAN
ncbi:MAG: DUF302 domain-containing protein [Pseudomonadota bacterium]